MRTRAVAGQHNYMNRIRRAFNECDYAVEFCANSPEARLRSAEFEGYSLFHMDPPLHDRALTTRLAYFYPFWRIEATEKRWEFRVAEARFSPKEIDASQARRFSEQWRRRLFQGVQRSASKSGFIYVPLQGLLLLHRSFQTCSPIEMIEATLANDPKRRVIATLHPKEDYSKSERVVLDDLISQHPRLEVLTGGMEQLLRDCDYIVTQNSSVALNGCLFQKPSVLFARIDFHHIAANVHELGVERAFEPVRDMQPDFEKYLFWFLKRMSINAGSQQAEDQILSMVRAHGWDV